MRQHYYCPPLYQHNEKLKCQDCQTHKVPGYEYGLLPERGLHVAPWEEVTIDHSGHWEVKINGRKVEFNALTCIDTASNLVELIRIDNKTATHGRDKFTQCWLCHCPQPICCICWAPKMHRPRAGTGTKFLPHAGTGTLTAPRCGTGQQNVIW